MSTGNGPRQDGADKHNGDHRRRDYRPTGEEPKSSSFATLKRTATEFSEDNLPIGRRRSPTTACWRCFRR